MLSRRRARDRGHHLAARRRSRVEAAVGVVAGQREVDAGRAAALLVSPPSTILPSGWSSRAYAVSESAPNDGGHDCRRSPKLSIEAAVRRCSARARSRAGRRADAWCRRRRSCRPSARPPRRRCRCRCRPASSPRRPSPNDRVELAVARRGATARSRRGARRCWPATTILPSACTAMRVRVVVATARPARRPCRRRSWCRASRVAPYTVTVSGFSSLADSATCLDLDRGRQRVRGGLAAP